MAFAHWPSLISRSRTSFGSSFLSKSTCTRSTFHRTMIQQKTQAGVWCKNGDSSIARKKVGAIIIGNEILNGKTLDTNLNTLAKHVDANGAILQCAVTIRDNTSIIANAVRDMSPTVDMVFTSGGIGPTLDDVTYEGVADAFHLPLRQHEDTVRRMSETQPPMQLNQARLRMATLPSECEILWTEGLWVPLAVVRNVYVLPGIPRLFQKMLQSVPADRFGYARRRERITVFCEMAEGDLAHLLENVAGKFEQVTLGSYPSTTEETRKKYRSMITVEGDDRNEVFAAAEIVRVGVNGRYEHNDSML